MSALIVVMAAAACGKKGPPLPPLVRVPIAPVNITADRRGDTVDVEFTVPDANTDRTKPANIERVDVYAITAPPTVTDDQILKRGTKVASVDVKAPKDPNQAVPEDDVDSEVEPAVGSGLDQGVAAHVAETLTRQVFRPADLGKEDRKARETAAAAGGPLLGPPPFVPARTYVAVGVTSRDRKGPLSKRVTAPLIEPPPAPTTVKLTYTEQEATVAWSPGLAAADAAAAVLPSRPLGMAVPAVGYNVYDVSIDPASGSSRAPQKINKTPTTDLALTDARMTWGETRCYVVRAVATVAGASVESAPSPAVCDTLKDTFPPAAPKGLRSVAGERMISLIWDPNTEADLAGYLVFRGTGGTMEPLTAQPIQETNFSDTVAPGVRFFYAIKAVDKAGNVSPFSERADETARE